MIVLNPVSNFLGFTLKAAEDHNIRRFRVYDNPGAAGVPHHDERRSLVGFFCQALLPDLAASDSSTGLPLFLMLRPPWAQTI